MTESSWGESEAPPPRKKVIPTWLWFCGGGCLLAVILGIVGGVWIFTKGKQLVEEAANPEKQWPRVAELLQYDEKPADVELRFGWHIGMEMYMFEDSHGFAEVLMRGTDANAQEIRDQMLDPEHSGGVFGMGGRRDMEPATVRVQGRDLQAMRFHQMDDESARSKDGAPQPGQGPSIVVDVTPVGAKRPVILQMIRISGKERVEDEDVQRFLQTFHVGPDR
jgi:hypothetical protein